MKLYALLAATAMVVSAASAEAANVVVNQTADLTKAGNLNGSYINGYDGTGVFSSPFLVDISAGDNVTLNFTFAGNVAVIQPTLGAGLRRQRTGFGVAIPHVSEFRVRPDG